MWLASDSSRLCPILVEIETPKKRWFRNNGVPDADFTQALDQITEWKAWFNEPPNRQVFRDFYRIPDDLWRSRAFAPKYVLVYGRREEFVGHDELNKKRVQQQRADETHMTFDRLYPEPKARDLLCASITKAGDYRAIGWPASAKVSPFTAFDWVHIKEKERALDASDGSQTIGASSCANGSCTGTIGYENATAA